MVGRDTSEPIRLRRLCKTLRLAGQQSLKQESPDFSRGECQSLRGERALKPSVFGAAFFVRFFVLDGVFVSWYDDEHQNFT